MDLARQRTGTWQCNLWLLKDYLRRASQSCIRGSLVATDPFLSWSARRPLADDQAGECRAHGNLGSAHFSKGSYKEALSSHRYQLVLAMKCKDSQAAALALTSLGHVYTAVGDYPNALASHKQCVQLVRQMGDRLQEAREVSPLPGTFRGLFLPDIQRGRCQITGDKLGICSSVV